MIISLKSRGFIRSNDLVKMNPDGVVQRMIIKPCLVRYRRKVKGLVFGIAVSASKAGTVLIETSDPINCRVTDDPYSVLESKFNETLRLIKFSSDCEKQRKGV